MRPQRRTKIVATIGPATRPSRARELIEAGADVLRLNFSHGTRDEHAENVEMARRGGASWPGERSGCSATCPGPKLRLGEVEGGVVELRQGSELDAHDRRGGRRRRTTCPVSWDGLPAAVARGRRGLPRRRPDPAARRSRPAPTRSAARSRSAGAVASHQGLNLPGADVAAAGGRAARTWTGSTSRSSTAIDLLAVSFVRRAEDLEPVERRVRVAGADIPLIAKIEKPQAAENAEEIIEAAIGGIMVARGDLGHRAADRAVPVVQKRLLALAGQHSQAVDHRDADARLDGRPRAARRAPR